MAIREINNKNDGIADHLLPSTRLEFAFSDSKCDLYHGMIGAQQLINDAFHGLGVHAMIGSACTPEATVPAAQLTTHSRIPMLSPSVDPSSLATGESYFLRMMPSSSLLAGTMVGFLRHLFNYTHVAMVQDSSNREAGLFFTEAGYEDLSILTRVDLRTNALAEHPYNGSITSDDYVDQIAELRDSGARVVVLFCTAEVAGRFLQAAFHQLGPGYLWFGTDAATSARLWQSNEVWATSPWQEVLSCFFGVRLQYARSENVKRPKMTSEGYLARRRQLPRSQEYADGSCNEETGAAPPCRRASLFPQGTSACIYSNLLIACVNVHTDDDGATIWAQRLSPENDIVTCAGDDPATSDEYEVRT
eukprot:4844447-Prymnesium_polylepis.2